MLDRVKAVLVAWAILAVQIAIAPLTLVLARSWRGRVEGAVALTLNVFLSSGVTAVAFLAVGRAPPTVVVGLIAVSFLAICVVGVAAFLLAQSFPRNFGLGPMTSHFFRPVLDPAKIATAAVEDEYAWVLVWLVTRLDWRMSDDEATTTRREVLALIDDVRTHPDYHGMARGSTVTSHGLMCGRLDPEHCYLYRPPESDRPLGLLVFLHGHGPNYLLTTHALRPLADEHNLAVVAPTFGYGNWEAAGGVDAVRRARDYAMKTLPIDPARVYLGGISQGGAGVGRAAVTDPLAYAGLVFISPTMEPDVLGSEIFAALWKRKPVLVIQGERDRNVTPESVADGVDVLRANGTDVTVWLDPEAGHFLFFTRLDEVLDRIGEWLRRGL